MVANILPLDTPSTLGVGSKGQNFFFLKEVLLHIRFKGIEHRAPCKHIFLSLPLGWGQQVKTFFVLKTVVLHTKLKGTELKHHASTYSVLTHTLDPSGGVKRSKHFFSESSHVAYQIKGNGA